MKSASRAKQERESRLLQRRSSGTANLSREATKCGECRQPLEEWEAGFCEGWTSDEESMASNFLVRSEREINKTDEHIAELTLGDRSKQMFFAWQDCAKCHLFIVGSSLFARGKKDEREFAKGFVAGWRRSLKASMNEE